ncbi:hypothetical protein Glove_346g61 [Diversispora epigaea]|uniref:NYN domain-containing protein n=1 Tax=Diversispora epigaea TaxID=1348612 RepID=A0A397HMM8_9GLOM|nr:hypothetical protein Glove_346g61 [Diversispora epigaea]
MESFSPFDKEMANLIKDYNTEELIEYLQNNLKLIETDFDIFRKERITGSVFLKMTKEDFCSIGFAFGPTMELTNFIEDKKLNTPKSNTELVYVFIDNSNLLIEGMYIVGDKEKTDAFDSYKNSYIINQLHLDYGRLLLTVLHKRKMGSNPVIVGSKSLDNDEIWSQTRNLGFITNVFYQNCENKEKMIDTTLVSEGVDIIKTNTPGILVLVAGNDNYNPLIIKALKYNWKVEIWFWSSEYLDFLNLTCLFIT